MGEERDEEQVEVKAKEESRRRSEKAREVTSGRLGNVLEN